MYSVKLSRVPHGTEQLSFKVAYGRNGTPSKSNPLDGLLNYTPFSDVTQTLATATFQSGVAEARAAARLQLTERLTHELPEQNIKHGKFKLQFKPAQEKADHPAANVMTTGEKARVRISGNVDDVAINHGHFKACQEVGVEGNTVEPLAWIVKLDHAAGPATARILEAYDTPDFRGAVENILRDTLARGDALELAIDAIGDRVRQVQKRLDLPVAKTRLSLRRPALLDHAVVVIGATIPGETPLQLGVKKIAGPNGYQDFATLSAA